MDTNNLTYSDPATKLFELEEGVWYYIRADIDFTNKVTAIRLQDGRISVQYIGGEFKESYAFSFDWNKAAMDEAWRYEFPDKTFLEDVNYQSDLDKIDQLSILFYHMVIDNHYDAKHAKELQLHKN
ncbi:hypothetical protein [Domibacillus robiginosus]|uniref:hypothetical protein n=1 Tax=Domibacillus robiginosus TaxID=1071054 RepID=UPI00067B4BAE|nr:hypothetical protein [Domibacillus robiginosus]